MTLLVFNLRSGKTVACNDWSAIEHPHGWCEVASAVGWMGGTTMLKMPIDEFLALIAEGGKIVDLRGLQESEQRAKSEETP